MPPRPARAMNLWATTDVFAQSPLISARRAWSNICAPHRVQRILRLPKLALVYSANFGGLIPTVSCNRSSDKSCSPRMGSPHGCHWTRSNRRIRRLSSKSVFLKIEIARAAFIARFLRLLPRIPIVPDTHQPRRKDMQAEARDELQRGKVKSFSCDPAARH
jgi:hypothetical protein